MKKGLKILCAALSLTAIMSFSAFAAETRKEYRAEAEPIRTEMKVMEEQMDVLRESNKTIKEHFKNIHLNKKETGELPVDKEVWKEAKTLHGKIKTIREENGDSQVKNLRAEAKAAAENKDFDTAILKLKEAEKEKASEGACHLADGHSVSGRTLFLPVLHAEQLCQALAHDLHSDGHVHHAPPVDGDVSAA